MSNITAMTRELWDKTVYKQVLLKNILIHMLLERKQVLKAGTAIKHTVDYAEMDSLVQEYGENDTLTSGKKTVAETAQWYPKFVQLPIEISGKDWRTNAGGGDGQMVSMPQYLVEKAQRGLKIFMNSVIYRAGSVTRDADVAGVQGLNDALTHDIAYGGLPRLIGTPTRTWWQGASLGDIWTDQATAMTPSIANVRKMYDKVSMYADKADVIVVTSNTNYRSLQSQVDGRQSYKPQGMHAKYGFESFSIDGIEVFAEPWLTASQNSSASTTVNYFYMLHLKDWTFHVDADRGLGNLSEFKHQAEIQGGTDAYLARLMFRGNFVCTQPNASMFKSGVTM